MRLSAFIFVGASCAWSLAVGTASAQDVGEASDAVEVDPQTEEARTLFSEGLSLAEEERFEEAAERFRRAYQLRPAGAIAFNLGNALVESGRLVEGTEMLRQVTRDAETSSEVRERAEWLLENAEPRIGSIVVHVTGHFDDVVVEVGGGVLGASSYGVPFSADPGTTEVRAVRGGDEVVSATVDVPEGRQAELTLEVPAPVEAGVAILPPVQTAPVESADDGGVLEKWWFWTAIGAVVVAAVVLGVVVSASGSNTEGSLGSGMLQ